MKKVGLLDCTLRDGGYINDWRFGRSTARCILERLIEAGVDIVEVGFLNDSRPFDPERTIQPNTVAYDSLLSDVDKKSSMLVAMIDYGTCAIENVSPCEESILDGIRVIFKKPKMREAVSFGQKLVDLGYEVFLQLVSITSYSDRELLDFIDLANNVKPFAVSMVDTYGLLQKEDLLHYFHLLDHNLGKNIRIGYHSHNNFQLAFSNTCELIKHAAERSILVDGTLYGMGKSAGNAPLELAAMYLNENYSGSYEISQLLEAIDTNILRIYHKKQWGYNLQFYLAASNDCHPNYIGYLLSKKTLSVRAINEIVKGIPPEKKLDYDKAVIEELYINYQKKTVWDTGSMGRLQAELGKKNLLLLGPGKTLISHQSVIDKYIQRERPVILSVNFLPDHVMPDFVFISNAKRYSMLVSGLDACGSEIKVIATSNITAISKQFDYVMDYAGLLDGSGVIMDNGLIMLLNALCACGPEKVVLAGFDGFGQHMDESYFDDQMEMSVDYDRLAEINAAIKERLPAFKAQLPVSFLTPSLYEGET